MQRISRHLPLAVVVLLGMGLGCSSSSTTSTPVTPVPVVKSTTAWSFGVMGDTQWASSCDPTNSSATVPTGIISQIDTEFINKGVKFVIQVGDLEDDGTPSNLAVREQAAHDLYAAGIGFYPLRGNHEGEDSGFAVDKLSAQEFKTVFPQTQGGDMGTLTPATLSLANFSTPGKVNLGDSGTSDGLSDLTGLSYSFDYANPVLDATGNPTGAYISPARFILLDQFTPPDATMEGLGKIAPQQTWINTQLAKKPKFVLNGQLTSGHAFVFSHKGLITENHVDTLFGNNVNVDPTSNCAQNATDTDNFINSLYNNGVRYYMGGHDHVHNRALVTNTKKTNAITNLIAASCSYKFYVPKQSPNDKKYDIPAYGFTRETEISQDTFRIGYYIFTVDGPNVTVDYYASDPQGAPDPAAPTAAVTISKIPTLTFTKRETFGYSLVGKEFTIGQGKDYTSVSDSYNPNPTSPTSLATSAKILAMAKAGVYNAAFNPADWTTWFGDWSGYANPAATPAVVASAPRALTRAVDTGWETRTAGLSSDIFKIWGMADVGSANTDTYCLSMSYDPTNAPDGPQLRSGAFGIATKGSGGTWVKAVSLNKGGTKLFVVGAYDPKYGLGTYGFDPTKNTAWAVINYQGDFAVANGL